jgi:HEAT repeat protein
MLWWSLRKLKSSSLETRVKAIDELAQYEDARAMDALAGVLANEDDKGSIGNRAAAVLLKKGDVRGGLYLLSSKDEKQRLGTAVTLAALGERAGIEALVKMMLAEDGRQFPMIVGAVTSAKLAVPGVTAAITNVLKSRYNPADRSNPDIALRARSNAYSAAAALGTIGDRSPDIVQTLVRVMKDSPWSEVRKSAEQSLRNLGAFEEVAKAKQLKPVRGGADEPYCSQECYETGGRYVFSLSAKGAQGPCGFCLTRVSVEEAIGIPHEGKTLFICENCMPKWREYLKTYQRCCYCQKAVSLE